MENNILKHRLAVRQNIQKSFNSDLRVDTFDELEKGKWSVGDTKVYQGVTWEVGGFNAKGAPLWRKKKGSGGNSSDTSLSTKTSDDSKQNSEDVKNKISDLKDEIEKLRKKHLELDSEYREAESKSKSGNRYTAGWNLSNLDKIKHDYEENKELLRKKKDILKKLENSINNDDSQHATPVTSEPKKDDKNTSGEKNNGNNLNYKNIILHRMDVPVDEIPTKEYKIIQKFIQNHDPGVDFRSLEDEDDFDDKMLVYLKSITSANLFNRGFSESFRRKLRSWNYAADDAIIDRIVKNQDKYKGDSKKFTFKNGKIQRVN